MVSRPHCREIGECVHRLLLQAEPDSAVGRKLTNWVREHANVLGLDFAKAVASPARGKQRARPNDKPLPRTAWKQLQTAVAKTCAQGASSDIARNAAALASALGLSVVEAKTFVFLVLAGFDRTFESLCERLAETRTLSSEQIIATAIEADRMDVSAALKSAALAGTGLVIGLQEYPGRFDLEVPHPVMRALRPPICDIGDIERALLGPPARTDLAWSSFDHLQAGRDFVTQLLKGALAQRANGINILFYGEPGTGKTELAKAIAREIGTELYAVGESDSYGDEPDRWDRLSALRRNQRLLKRRGGGVVLFDEMEDVLQNGDAVYVGGRRIRRAGSKVHFNRLLEGNPVPTIWTANSLEEFDPAFLRRMSFAMRFMPAPQKVRAKQWSSIAGAHGVHLDGERIRQLASEHRIAPSLIESASRAVATGSADAGEVDFVVRSLSRMTGNVPRRSAIAPGHHVDLLNADHDLATLEARLKASGRRDLSFCLYGPSGTGKSAYARRLAETMGLEVLEKRGTDLLSMWVGGTEERIAAAFEQAANDECFLIIDEVEGFLWSRAESSKSWETTMVNEFLTWLESHRWPVACTTNHLERIDPAALRRFTFKVRLEPLTREQCAMAFVRTFGVASPVELNEIEGLTVGDFAVVAKQLKMADGCPDTAEIVALLAAEARAKPQNSRRIGF